MENLEEKVTSANANKLLSEGNLSATLAELKLLRTHAISDYNLARKLSKIATKLIAQDSKNSIGLKKVKLALLSSSTTDFFKPIIKYFGIISDIDIELLTGDFGNWKQDILNPNSWLTEANPDLIIIATNYRDANLPFFSKDADLEVSKTCNDFAALWRELKRRFPKATILQHDFDLPAFDSTALLSDKVGGRRDTLTRISLELEKRSKLEGVEIIKFSKLQAIFGSQNWEDARMWFHAKQHPSMDALGLLAMEYARVIRAKLYAPKKVCVLDLDNTLWGGVIGEDGLGGIALGAPNARGEAYVAFQLHLKELKERGIILAVCSKNNIEDALLPFEKHDSMVLKREDITVFKANWLPKSANIEAIAKELNLGLDSFVFVDDNPIEIQEVSGALPQVECLLLPEDPADFIKFLSKKNLFDSLSISEDDLTRSDAYRQNSAREELKASFTNLDDFLKSLEMKCEISNINEANIARVTQLLGKTNQFNLTTRRESEELVREIISNPKNYARCFKLSDKFGNNGIVGIAIATFNESENLLSIDSFVMSCRVIARGLENFILNDIAKFAEELSAKTIRGTYIPTKKNVQTKDFYANNGFSKISDSNDIHLWEIQVDCYEQKKLFIEHS